MSENNLIEVKTYDELTEGLKVLGVTPKEAFSLVFKSKFHYDRRHFWTMYRITRYLRRRMIDALNLKSKYNVEVKYPKKLWSLYYKELKEEKWFNEKIIGEPGLNFKKDGKFHSTLYYVDPAYWSDLCNAILEDKEIIKLIKTKMPKKIDTCRKLNDEVFEFNYKYQWFSEKKFDAYQETLNLHKLVTEKRHNKKFSPSYLDIRKVPNWNNIKWEMPIWKELGPSYFKLQYEKSKKKATRMRKTIPDYAKSAQMWEDPKPDDGKYLKINASMLKHSRYGGKLNEFKYFTQRNIDLIR